MNNKVLCGVSEVSITPKIGGLLPGYYEQRVSTDIIDDIYAKTVLFSNGKIIVGVVELDLCYFLKKHMEIVRSRASDKLGINTDGIMIAATHTHTGASVDDTGHDICVASDEEVNDVINKAVDSIVLAYTNLKEFKIGIGRTNEYEVSFNRRWFMKDGKVHTWPGINNPDNVKPAAGIDPEVDVIRIDSLDGEPIAVITNFANHLDCVGENKYCADYPGEISRIVKDKLGNNVVSIFMNGCAGDITHVDYSGKYPLVEKQYELIGKKLASDIFNIYFDITTNSIDYINSITETLVVNRRQFSKTDYDDAIIKIKEFEKIKDTRDKLDQKDDEFEKPTTGDLLLQEMSYAYAAKELYENPILTEDLSIQVIKVGNIVFNSMPGEMFNELGIYLKKKSKYKNNIMVELANGYHSYIATEKAYSEGGYETTFDFYMNLETTAGNKIMNKLLDIQERV